MILYLGTGWKFLRLTRISNVPVFTIPHENNTDVSVSHEQVDTQYSPLLCAFPPLPLSDGVELTGAESFTVSGSKDKLLNTHAQVTYVFARLPDSFSSPTCSVSPSCLCFLFALFSLCSYFSPCVFVSKMNFCTRGSVIWHCAIELASVKCTKLHSSNKTEPILASLPGAFTLNGVVDCFNPACFHCVKDNKLLSYSKITLVLRKCNVAQFFCGRAKALSNIDA